MSAKLEECRALLKTITDEMPWEEACALIPEVSEAIGRDVNPFDENGDLKPGISSTGMIRLRPYLRTKLRRHIVKLVYGTMGDDA